MQKIHYKSEQDSVRQRLFFFFHSGAHRSPLLPPLDRLLSSIGTRSVADGQRGEEGEGYKGGGGRREKRKSRGHLPRLEGEEATWKQDFLEGGGPFFHRKHKICMLRMLKLFIFTKKFFRHVHVQQIKCNDLRKERATTSNMVST